MTITRRQWRDLDRKGRRVDAHTERIDTVADHLDTHGETGVEYTRDYDGLPYLSIPTGLREAVEIETDPSDARTIHVTVRAWDRTGGVSHEHEIGSFKRADHAAAAAVRAVAERAAYWARLEADMTPGCQHPDCTAPSAGGTEYGELCDTHLTEAARADSARLNEGN